MNPYDDRIEIAPGVTRTDLPYHIHFEGTRDAMLASGLIPPAWAPAGMSRKRKQSHVFVQAGCLGYSCAWRMSDGQEFVSIELDRGGKPEAQVFGGEYLKRSIRSDKQLQRFLRDAARLRLVESEKE